MPPSPGVALVTGAGSGIGRATAVLLARHGWNVALCGRRRAPLAETAALLGSASEVITADVGNAADAARMVESAVSRFGRLDALVNNAGYAPLLPIDRTTPEVIDEVYRVNALGPAYAIARAWPVFVRQRGGCIVNVSTLGTFDPFPGFFAYAAAKSAVNSMARSCAKEGVAHDIRAFAVAPGAVETAMLRAIIPESSLPRSATLAPEGVARVIVDAVTGRYDDRNGDTITVGA
jgi:NAD(P)-dependent dehydrogenase (short-subunit alcohol dehydrogenase family)